MTNEKVHLMTAEIAADIQVSSCPECDELVLFSKKEEAALQAIADGRVGTFNTATHTVVAKADAERLAELEAKAAKYDALHTPEIADFLKAVENEALYQRERWGSDHDAGKTDADWFWLIAHLASKAILKPEKLLHHLITTAAALLNWHAARTGAHTGMRPGIGQDKHPPQPAEPQDSAKPC